MELAKTNSIIKAINYEEFTEIIGTQKASDFISEHQKGSAIICFIADWSVPSRTAVKKIKKKHIERNKVGVIDVDLVDSIDMCNFYEVKAVPHFVLFKNGQSHTQFSGCRMEMINEIFSNIEIKGGSFCSNSSNSKTQCPNGHDLQILTSLPEVPYTDNLFYCNGCKKIIKCTQEHKVGHCGQCDYDLCFSCL